MSLYPYEMPEDLTGTSARNKVTNERREFKNANDRIFVPTAGPFYTESLIVVNDTNGKRLEPITQYKCLHLHQDASNDSGKQVCCVIVVNDITIKNIRITYQAAGGKYGEVTTTIKNLLSGIDLKNLGKVAWGTQVYGKPETFPPSIHKHPGGEFGDWKRFHVALNNIYQGIINKDQAAWQSVYDYFNREITIALDESGLKDFDGYSKKEIDARFTTLSNTIAGLTRDLGTANGKITTLTNSLTTANGKITTLESNYNTLNSKLTALTTRVDKLPTVIPPTPTPTPTIELSKAAGNRLTMVSGGIYYSDNLRIRNVTSSYTLADSDLDGNTIVRVNTGSASNVVIPVVNDKMAVGGVVHIRQINKAVTIVGATGVNISPNDSLVMRRAGLVATLLYLGANRWDLITELE